MWDRAAYVQHAGTLRLVIWQTSFQIPVANTATTVLPKVMNARNGCVPSQMERYKQADKKSALLAKRVPFEVKPHRDALAVGAAMDKACRSKTNR
jgi:hypothetical protein